MKVTHPGWQGVDSGIQTRFSLKNNLCQCYTAGDLNSEQLLHHITQRLFIRGARALRSQKLLVTSLSSSLHFVEKCAPYCRQAKKKDISNRTLQLLSTLQHLQKKKKILKIIKLAQVCQFAFNYISHFQNRLQLFYFYFFFLQAELW